MIFMVRNVKGHKQLKVKLLKFKLYSAFEDITLRESLVSKLDILILFHFV